MRRCSGLLTVSQRKFGKKWEDAVPHVTRRRGGRPENYVIGAVAWGGEGGTYACSSVPLSGNGPLSHVAHSQPSFAPAAPPEALNFTPSL